VRSHHQNPDNRRPADTSHPQPAGRLPDTREITGARETPTTIGGPDDLRVEEGGALREGQPACGAGHPTRSQATGPNPASGNPASAPTCMAPRRREGQTCAR